VPRKRVQQKEHRQVRYEDLDLDDHLMIMASGCSEETWRAVGPRYMEVWFSQPLRRAGSRPAGWWQHTHGIDRRKEFGPDRGYSFHWKEAVKLKELGELWDGEEKYIQNSIRIWGQRFQTDFHKISKEDAAQVEQFGFQVYREVGV